MKNFRKNIFAIWRFVFIWFLIFQFEQKVLEPFVNSHTENVLLGLLKAVGALLVIISSIIILPYYYLHLPRDFFEMGVVTAILLGTNYILLYYENIAKAKGIQRQIDEKAKRDELERKIIEDRKQKEKEVERRKDIVSSLINNQYRDTEREVNKTLIPTLINELYDLYLGLNSENLNNLIVNGSITDFESIISSMQSELSRLHRLALNAQAKGYTDSEDGYANSTESDVKMTKGKAFLIFGLSPTATKDEIKKEYRNLAKKYNTDQRTHYEDHIKQMLEDKMKEVNSAKSFFEMEGII
jgi:DnaJ domain